MKDQPAIMVLLIEDNMEIAGIVSDYFELEGIECDHAYEGHSGLEFALSGRYDVIVLDLMLPNLDGIRICQELRDRGVDTPILMLTARDTLQDKIEGFNAGADDYLIKPFEMEELVLRTRVLSRRRSGEVRRITIADMQIDFANRTVQRSGQVIDLSPTNWILLEVLANNSPNVVSRDRLSMALWQGEPPDTDALKSNIYKLRCRIDKPFASSLIQTVPGQGLALRES
ncbi:response regulator transcription factor [Thalassospira marina]|uniref:Two-component system response regulator n=1 Tax=Thalassospira marina TaxID=2048283 RepID=A0ABM6QBD8_9PROT|nr:response regulator transcription factor [Thalassospira marina]AUG53875.1 two-component system response regulator [Thalassospira marina]